MTSPYLWILMLQTLTVFLSEPAEAGTHCPDGLTILPCSCKFSWPYTEVSCYATKTNHKLLAAALNQMSLHGMVIDKMVFQGNLNYIPKDFFKTITVHYLVFRTPELAGISDDAFNELSSVHSLWLYGTNFTSVPIRALSRSKLTELLIYNNNIDNIGVQLFGQLIYGTVLRMLHLTSNGIKSIGIGAFYNLISLEELSLKGNKLTTIDSFVLPVKNKFMKKLILQKNLLTEVPIEIIRRMPAFATVDLSVNQISTGDFHTILQLNKKIDLLANRLDCNCSMLGIAIYNDDNPGSLKLRGNCVAPSSMIGKFLKDLRTTNFRNCLKLSFLNKNLLDTVNH